MPAIPTHHTGTEDSPWDGPAAVAAMPAEYATLHYCHAWWSQEAADSSHKAGDDDADDEKGSYKFPHHRKDGGPANIPGCVNGKSRLESANIPDADRDGVKAHLQAHIDDHDKEHGDSDASENRADGPLVAMRFPGERSIDLAAMAGEARWQRALTFANMTDEQRVKAHLPRAKRLSNRADWFRITDFTDGTPARLDIYDEIGWSWFDEGVTASTFNQKLQAITAPSIELHINSPGGDVFDGLAILNLLRATAKPIDVIVDGLAASAASFIAQAGDTVTMMPQSQMMIHDASGVCFGNAAEMTEMAELLDHMSQNIADVYAMRTGAPADDWRMAMKTETWYSADEAVAAGLADKVGAVQRGQKVTPEPAETAVAATAKWNLSFYNYDGRATAPAPQTPVGGQPRAAADLPPDPTPVPAPPVIDTETVRAAFAGAFRPTMKEAR